jgi:hypothetical protein
VAGAGTGLFVSFVLTPIELVKCRMQVSGASGPGGHVYRGPLDCLQQSIARDGLGVVYRGHAATMLREIPGTAAWFGAYEMFARAMTPPGVSRDALPASTIIASGALGGMAYWTIMYPCDTVKSAMQISDGPLGAASPAQPQAPHSASAPAVAAASAAGRAATPTAGAGAGSAAVHGVATASAAHLSKVAAVAGAVVTPAPAVALSGAARRVAMAAAAGSGVAVAAAAAAGASGANVASMSTLSGSRGHGVAAAHHAPSPTFMSTFRAVYRAGGTAALYAGFLPTLMRAAPSNAAIFVGYEWAKGHLQPLMLA